MPNRPTVPMANGDTPTRICGSDKLRYVRLRALNSGQRLVVVVGLGLALYFFGGWVTTRDTFSGWVAYAPLSNTVNVPGGGLHPWVRLLIWLALIFVWVLASVALLRTHSESDSG